MMVRLMKKIGLALQLVCLFGGTVLSGCTNSVPQQSIQNSPYTHGNVQLHLKKGVTSQADVLNVFGAPNIATTDETGQEIWTYQKNATVANSNTSNSFGTVIIAGVSNGSSGFEQSSRTMTLIIKFDKGKVSDFKSMSSSF